MNYDQPQQNQKKNISHMYTNPTKSVTLHGKKKKKQKKKQKTKNSSLLLYPRTGKEKKLGKYQNKYIKMYQFHYSKKMKKKM
jgi:hypothetical protein